MFCDAEAPTSRLGFNMGITSKAKEGHVSPTLLQLIAVKLG